MGVGTASIRGHESVALGNVPGPLAVTVENLNVVLAAMGLPPLGVVGGMDVFTKVCLRRRSDLGEVRDALGAAAAGAQFLQADVCRPELELEIEVSARNFPQAPSSD